MGYEDDMQEYYDTRKYIKNTKTTEVQSMTKYFKFINTWLVDITQLLTNIFVFAIVCGLLFNDPFGVIGVISNLITKISDNGLAGIISLAILLLLYKR